MSTIDIKNLSIALEALSRINNEGSPTLYDRVSDILDDKLKEFEQRTSPRKHPQTELDDEIPF